MNRFENQKERVEILKIKLGLLANFEDEIEDKCPALFKEISRTSKGNINAYNDLNIKLSNNAEWAKAIKDIKGESWYNNWKTDFDELINQPLH